MSLASKMVPCPRTGSQQIAATTYTPAKVNSTMSHAPVLATIHPATKGNTAAPILPDMFITLNTVATCFPPMSMVMA